MKGNLPPEAPLEIVRNGTVVRSISFSGRTLVGGLDISPDGTKAVVEIPTANNYIGVVDLATGSLTRLTFRHNSRYPLWIPGGDSISFLSDRSGANALYRISAEGGETQYVMSFDIDPVVPAGWSEDGDTFLYFASSPETQSDLWRAQYINGEWRNEALLKGPYNEYEGVLSPDGSMLAYSSDETGKDEVFVVRYPELTGKRRVSVAGGFYPQWSVDGRRLAFAGEEGLFTVQVSYGAAGSEVSNPKVFDETGRGYFGYRLLPDERSYARIRDVFFVPDRGNADMIWFISDFRDTVEEAF
jgi:Tol biopolymer transport system component